VSVASPNSGNGGIELPTKMELNVSIVTRLIELVKLVGLNGLIAGGLVWWMATGLSKSLDRFFAVQAEHEQTMRSHLEQSAIGRAELRYYLRQACINSAQTDQQRTNCLAGP